MDAPRPSFLYIYIMHIVEIPSFFIPYGGEFCLEQSKALRSLGHEVRIISNVQLSIKRSIREFFAIPFGREYKEIDGIPVYQSYMRGIPKCIRPNVRRWTGIVRSMYAQYVKTYGVPDIIHAHCAKWAGYTAMLISREYGVPYAITEHLPKMNLDREFGPEYGKAWQVGLLKEAYSNADVVIPVSEELVEDIAPIFGKDYKWRYISNTIDTEFFHYRPRTSLNDRRFRLCCLANFTYRKGYDILFEAFAMLHDSHPQTELHIAGLDTDGLACQELARHYIKDDSITSHGNLDRTQVRELLYSSDVFVLASRSEVQPLSILEAMSTGIPVVSTECVPRSLRIDNGCFIAPIDNAAKLCKLMSRLVDGNGTDGRRISCEVEKLASKEAVGKKIETEFIRITEKKHRYHN